MRPAFEKAGARLSIVSAAEQGADDFRSAVWTDGDLYIDEEESFKKALGGRNVSVWRALQPSAIARAIRIISTGNVRQSTADVTNKKTKLLGGTFVVKDGQVVFTHYETPNFDNGEAREILAAVLGKKVADLPAECDT
uniref:Peroxiredoxin-like 2 activated in M-CSF stimulated monocytes n=1 Tax=Calcidiscus leptoporus TaxID=127549 RepID=A0A7S0P590_9EUKA|mmetsp:Transcript_641/g.1439  ORF Transcript_641/g.1439 Transcript_641/m.1439 type:complete len:138 (+) Transcript_641:258-671(+)